MNKRLSFLAALIVIAIPAVSPAAPIRPGPYVSGFIGAGAAQDTNVTTTIFGPVGGTINDRVEFDPSIYLGGTGGFDFGYVRLEGELSYKHSEITTVNDKTNNVRYANVDGSIGALAMMFNTFINLRNDTPITPYFGGGVGFATLHLSDTSGVNTTTGTPTALYQSDNDTVFAYQAGAGVEIALNRRVSLDLGYRYFGTSTATFNKDVITTTDLIYRSHNGAIGVRVKF
jgi:opacity protein-like surface antigen